MIPNKDIDKNRKKEVHMEKYRFDRKLQEAVLKRMGRKQSIITINGEERKVRCPVFIKTDTSVIPCLVKEDSKTGNTGYTVVAVSFDELDAEEKNWICIQPVFLERAIEFFMESNQMESMTGDCRCAERLPDTRDSGFDFETKNALVEIKVPLIVSNGTVSCIWKSFHQAVKQMIGYCNSSYVKKRVKG